MAMQPHETENLKSSREGGKLLVSIRRFCLVAFLIAAPTWATVAQTQPGVPSGAAPLGWHTNTQPETGAPAGQALKLSPEAAQVAEEIGVAPLLDQLDSKRAAGSPMNLETLEARQEITE